MAYAPALDLTTLFEVIPIHLKIAPAFVPLWPILVAPLCQHQERLTHPMGMPSIRMKILSAGLLWSAEHFSCLIAVSYREYRTQEVADFQCRGGGSWECPPAPFCSYSCAAFPDLLCPGHQHNCMHPSSRHIGQVFVYCARHCWPAGKIQRLREEAQMSSSLV